MTVSRFSLMHDWLCTFFKIPSIHLHSLTGDAGFRKYYRFTHQGQSYIAVDAIPEMSNNLAFVELQKALSAQKVTVPDILAFDLATGFFCISDFGDVLFSDELTEVNMLIEYKKAINILPKISVVKLKGSYKLPEYDADFVRLELSIFTEWLLAKHLELSLSEEERELLEQCFDVLVNNVLAQPKVTMHRDFHCRNLMQLPESRNIEDGNRTELGVIDFQDAVNGPITYDIVSLLRDCYVKWPQESVDKLFDYFCELMRGNEQYSEITPSEWRRWFDLTGIQRHIKASGIFARLYHRDNKSSYLKDIPLTLSYIVDVSQAYPELKTLHDIVNQKVIPAVNSMDNI